MPSACMFDLTKAGCWISPFPEKIDLKRKMFIINWTWQSGVRVYDSAET